MPRRGGRKKKTRTHVPMTEEEIDAVPKSMVIRRTRLDKEIRLVEDALRTMMAPFTAVKLRESLKAKMKEILATAGNFGARNLILLYQREEKVHLKCGVSPQGPTFTFRLRSFHLASDLVAQLGVKSIGCAGLGAAFPVVHGFERHRSPRAGELTARLLRGLFPPDTHFVHHRPRRLVVFFYDGARDVVEVRNYKLSQEMTGVSAAVRRILATADFDFAQVDDAGEVLFDEDQAIGERKRRLGLDEIAPRLVLQLVKIEEGLLGGEVLFHALVRKSDEEVGQLKRKAAERAETRAQSIRVQEKRVAEKKAAIEAKREAKRAKHKPSDRVSQSPDFNEEGSDNENKPILAVSAKAVTPRRRIKKAV